jgi:hypothetical protein
MKHAIAAGVAMAVLAGASMNAAAGAGLIAISDDAGGRVYELTREGVDVREFATRRRIAHVPLPDWVWVGRRYSCPPTITLAPNGDPVVTSNIVPFLWRIDRATLATTMHEPVLDADKGRDFGFVGMRWSAELRGYHAVTTSGAGWRIDPALASAQKLAAAPVASLGRSCNMASLGS